jgi:sulfite reductase alpha subunit-like flavoprotein
VTLILFGTQTGNSELVAHDVAAVLASLGEEAEVVDMAEAYPEMLEDYARLIVSVCTWAEGTFPDNAIAFWESLASIDVDCSRLAYGIIALGDRLYDPYYQVAAYRLADRLEALGASRAAEMLEIDGPVLPSVRRAVRDWAARFVRDTQAA